MKYLFLVNGVSWKALLVLNCVDSLAGRGIFKDEERIDGKYVKLPIDYFRYFCKIYERKSASDKNAVNSTEAPTITRL